MLAGTAMSAFGKIEAGNQQKQALDANAAMWNMAAGQSVASGIQGAEIARRRAKYVASSARAATAASGMTTTGASAVAQGGLIRGEGEYNALTQLYQGEGQAGELAFRGANAISEGNASQAAGWMAGTGSALSGGTDWYTRYAA